MNVAMRVSRAVDRVTSRGHNRVTLPTRVLMDLLVALEAARRTQEGVVEIVRNIGRRRPMFIPPECDEAEIERLRGLVGRMLPLVDHSDRDGCPMAFHRSDGEECTCGALDAVREARATLAKETGGA